MNNILDNIHINKTLVTPGGSSAIIIDGIYKNQNIIAKLGFTADPTFNFIGKDLLFPFGLEVERDINDKLINKINSPYVVKMIDSSYLNREYVDKFFKNELIQIQTLIQKYQNKGMCSFNGFNFDKLVIMIFEKVENFTELYKFKGSLKDWLDILWNISQAYNIFNLYGLRHLDPNLTNILVIQNLECTTIKIIDFGFSSVQPTKLNNKLKIFNKTRTLLQNKKNYKYDLNKIIKNLLNRKKLSNQIKILLKSFNNKTPAQALKLIKNYK
jgi:hypothetical protein